jgi:hypothetical protein
MNALMIFELLVHLGSIATRLSQKNVSGHSNQPAPDYFYGLSYNNWLAGRSILPLGKYFFVVPELDNWLTFN